MDNSVNPTQLQIILDGHSHNALVRLGDALGLLPAHGKSRKAEILSELARFLGQPEHLRAAKALLSPKHWQALSLCRLRDESVMLYGLFARLKAQGFGEAEALSILDRLLSLGCLVCKPISGSYEGKIELQALKLESSRELKRWAFSFPLLVDYAIQREDHAARPPHPVRSDPAQVRPGAFAELRREVYLVLRAAAGGQVRLTMAGIPYRTDAAKLATALAGQSIGGSPGLSGRKLRDKKSDREPTQKLWFVLSLLMASTLVEESEGKLMASAEMAEFLRLPSDKQAAVLSAAWLDCCFDEFGCIESLQSYPYNREQPWVGGDPERSDNADRPNWRRLRMARRSIIRVLSTIAKANGGWIGVSDMAAATWVDDPEFLVPFIQAGYSGYYYYGSGERRPFQRPYNSIYRLSMDAKSRQLQVGQDWQEVEGAFVAQVVTEPLYWLGLIDLGLDNAGKVESFRLSSIGRYLLLGENLPSESVAEPDAPALIVQPNFDLVVVNADANFSLLALLDEFAERRSLHGAATYRLTRESVIRGLDKELTGEGIIELLEKTAQRPLPQNVRYSIEEWVRLYERLRLRRQAALLEADSAEQMDSWLSDFVLSPLIGRRLSPTVALVSAAHWEQVLKLLRERRESISFVDYSRPATRFALVDPSASISVPLKYDEPYLRYRLGRFAERLESGDGEDREVRYRITSESVGLATSARTKAADIVSFLVSVAAKPVPLDVILRVEGWGGAYKPLRYESVVAVQTPPGLTWPDLGSVPEIANLVLRWLEPTMVLIAVDRFGALQAALAERGITLEAGLPAPAQVAPPAPAVLTIETKKQSASRSRKLKLMDIMRELEEDFDDEDYWEDD